MLTNKEIFTRLQDEYGSLEDAMLCDNEGICHACGEIASEVEPDARNYKCWACGKYEVYGIEQTIITLL